MFFTWLYQQPLNDIWDARIDKGASLANLFTNGLSSSLRDLGRTIYKTPTSIDVASELNSQNINFTPNNAVPSTALFVNDTPSPREFNMQNQLYEQKLIYDDEQKKYAKGNYW